MSITMPAAASPIWNSARSPRLRSYSCLDHNLIIVLGGKRLSRAVAVRLMLPANAFAQIFTSAPTNTALPPTFVFAAMVPLEVAVDVMLPMNATILVEAYARILVPLLDGVAFASIVVL
jgi:hypothetical protein